MTNYLLSFAVFIPLAMALVILFIPSEKKGLIRLLANIGSILQLIASVCVFCCYEASSGLFNFVERVDWISLDLGSLGSMSIDYYLGVDGFNVSMVLLTGIVMAIGTFSSWGISEKTKGYYLLLMLLATSVMGCFLALDFFLFFLFFEFMLLPMYFLIGLWGGPRKEYAAIKFFLYTLLGSVFILLAMVGLYLSVIDPVETAVNLGLAESKNLVTPQIVEKVQLMLASGELQMDKLVRTFDIIAMQNSANFIPGSLLDIANTDLFMGVSLRMIAFIALLIGFAIKLPAVPVHTWLPDAHVEAPTPISVILAGILLKIGGYGLIRTGYSIFPDMATELAWTVGLIGVVTILYGSLNALAMKDLKKLIAYSSVSHMGFVLLGLASLTNEGVSGALYQMFSHGLISSALFLIAGVVYERTHDRMINHYSGLAKKMPYFTSIVIISFFASLGLPGFSGFIAEILVFLGAFGSSTTNFLLPRWMTVVAALSLVITAAYYLWTLQRMFFGKFSVKENSWKDSLKDLNMKEYLVLVPLVALMIVFGLMPNIVFDLTSTTVASFLSHFGPFVK
ncbi:complex I subunit 4 family protein [Aureibacter tunicatorum]|uniref:NADH-quinone oxidoreductase subunit M n=1 Tax=Aureibacter tunicatorum TaxID=866807 RepID=A0AAE3XPR0_9BACT|nr:NADH-quinone oxidoreductase subunit M [Aureibacter tunicatorum]MDR6239059.1 NADH-quinone oxidoreductase subunit M [Aureibacter tunicatorum]BDD05015.1 oxidoreductase [Aureibacter tunicatorum]